SGKALDEVADHLAKRSAVKLAAAHGIGERRAATLLAGAVILAQATRVVGGSFEVARAGLREGLDAGGGHERQERRSGAIDPSGTYNGGSRYSSGSSVSPSSSHVLPLRASAP